MKIIPIMYLLACFHGRDEACRVKAVRKGEREEGGEAWATNI